MLGFQGGDSSIFNRFHVEDEVMKKQGTRR